MLIPEVGSFDPAAAAVTALAFLLLFRFRWSVLRTLGVRAAVGATLHLATL
jgi:chromate transporter